MQKLKRCACGLPAEPSRAVKYYMDKLHMIVFGRFARTFASVAVAVVGLALPVSQANAQKLHMPGDTITTTPAEVDKAVESYSTGTTQGNNSYSQASEPMDFGVEPWSATNSGIVYSPSLGAHIRARFNTRSYGQEQGNLDLGTMRHWDYRGGVSFIDGQVTLNEESHVGYNVGIGYRWMTLPMFPNSPDKRKIMGINLWSDGQGAGGENFFPQVGVGLEYLGDRIDFRANGYIPVGPQIQNREATSTGPLDFGGNNLVTTLIGTQDVALTVGELELATRITDLEAWAFAGVYGMRGGPVEEVGGKAGLRGFLTPDLMASIAITHDEEFDTNAVFNLTWFIGRTRMENAPCGRLEDRFRNPVIRNDYVALAQRTFTQNDQVATDTAGADFRFVHIDSSAAPGGDGTFEDPFDSLDAVTGLQENDIILAHGGSTLAGSMALVNGNQFFGEGADQVFSITTQQFGTVNLPETATGAASGPVPILTGTALGDTVTLAENNTVQNLTFDGGSRAIVNATTGTDNPNLSQLTIQNMTGNAIDLATVVAADAGDIDNDGNTTETRDFLGNVVIDQVTFNNNMGSDIVIDATLSSMADEQSGESATLTNITTTRGANPGTVASIDIENTSSTINDQITISDYTFTGTTGGAFDFDSIGGDIFVSNSTITGGNGPAVTVTNADMITTTGGLISVGSTVTINDVVGTAVSIQDNVDSVTIDADINTAMGIAGGNVSVLRNEGNVSFGGNISSRDATGATLAVTNSRGSVNVSGDLSSFGTGDAVAITDAVDDTLDNATAGVTITGNISVEQGRAVTVDGGDDDVTINGTISDDNTGTSTGILVQNRQINSQVVMSGQTTLNTGANNAVTLSGVDNTAQVDFGEIDITTTSGTALTSSNIELNATGVDSTITTDTGRAIVINGGSSTNGVNFATVDVATGDALAPIDLTNFDGNVVVNGGTITSQLNEAIAIDDASLSLTDVNLAAGGTNAIVATYSGTTARTLNVTNMDANGDGFVISTPGDGGVTAGFTTITNSGGFDFDANGAGTLTANLNTIDGTGDLAVDVTSTGNAVVGGSAINLGGMLSTTTSAASTGNASVTINDSGDTSNFTGFDFNSNGGGSLTANLTNVTGDATANTTLDVTGSGSADINYTTVNAGGTVVANVSNTGTGNADIAIINSGATTPFSGFDFSTDGGGDMIATLTNVTAANNSSTTLNVNSTGSGILTTNFLNTGGAVSSTIGAGAMGNATVDIDDSGLIDAFTGFNFANNGDGTLDVDIDDSTGTGANTTFNIASTGNGTLNMTNVTTGGTFDIDASNAGSATATLTNVTGNGNTTLDVTGDGDGALIASNFNTGGTVVATGGGAATGDVVVSLANSGNTTAFTGLTLNEAGDGNASLTLTTTTSTSGVDFDSAGLGDATLTVNGGSYGGTIDADATNTGSFTSNISNLTQLTGAGTDVDLNAQNTGTIDFELNALNYTTGDNSSSIVITLGNNITTGGIDIQNSTITTGSASVFDLDQSGGNIDFRLNNNTFNNSSGALANTDIQSDNGSRLNATITGNVFDDSIGGSNPFDIETLGAGTALNLNLNNNTSNSGGVIASGNFAITEGAGSQVGIFELTETFNNDDGMGGQRNNGNMLFNPALIGDYNDLPVAPPTP